MINKVKKTLASERPDLLDQWHPSKNVGLDPNNLSPQSNKKVWWKCPKGPKHEWEAKIITRPMGIESYGTSRNGRVNISKAKFNEFYGQFGWINEDIRILNNYTFNERNDRILKAIKYMAVQNGAKLKETYF